MVHKQAWRIKIYIRLRRIRAVGGDSTVAGVTVVFNLCRFCQVCAGIYKASVMSYFIAAGLGHQSKEPWPAAGAAGPSH
jgi:hypothetical protein